MTKKLFNFMGMFSLLTQGTQGTKGALSVLTLIFYVRGGLFDTFFDATMIINGCI